MNIKQLHTDHKGVSAVSLFKSETAVVSAIQLLPNETLKEHITKVPALLLCIEGQVIFENENGLKETLNSGEYILIEPFIKHKLIAEQLSQLVLVK